MILCNVQCVCNVSFSVHTCREIDVQSFPAPPGLSQSLVARVTGGSLLEADQLEKVQLTDLDSDATIYIARNVGRELNTASDSTTIKQKSTKKRKKK